MIEDANPIDAEPRDLTLEVFTDFEGKNYYRVTHKEFGLSMGSTVVREAYDTVNAEIDKS